ncbi:MAG: hypothetical protein H7Z42_03015 [Roseiflexaceae bacterium]|nr:hypothetical protein [Roseiflexaceae bacterium]
MNLIPTTPGSTPSYWCTWGIQNFSLGDALASPEVWARDGFHLAMRNLDEQRLFLDPGWAMHPFAPVRADLYIVFDVGWDVPRDTRYPDERWRLGSLEVDAERFPSCTGTPTERLHALNALVQAAGWRGAGLWVSPQVVGDRDGNMSADSVAEAYWRERARWSHTAGIAYWKVDIGARSNSGAFRQMLTRVAREEAPGLWVEHGTNSGPLNDVAAPWDSPEQIVATQAHSRFATWGAIPERSLELLAIGDVFRTYDVTAQLSVATTLDRVAYLLQHGHVEDGARGLLNCEDEPYLGAALGCAIGVMRHPQWQDFSHLDYDPANFRQRMDEVTRAVRWQRIAPAFGVAETSMVVAKRVLTDQWLFERGQTWAAFIFNQTIAQGAPAVVARGMPLPEIQADGEPPFVIASRHPNGAVAVATLPRTMNGQFITPPAHVALYVGPGDVPIGVFGHYQTLTLRLDTPLGQRRIWAQDLAGNQAQDITTQATNDGTQITLPGALLHALGTLAATPGDRSEPGVAIAIA